MSGLTATVALTQGDLHLDAAFEVGPGETLAVLGPNGAGKTTLLRALAGAIALDQGSVVLDGVVLERAPGGERVPSERRPVGLVYQDYLLFPHLDTLDNVAFGLRARGTGRRDARRRAQPWLERVGLGDRGRAKPGELSGGQQQRVALARALAVEPRLLLLDEPLAALDVGSRRATRRVLRDVLGAFYGCRILVTHDPVEAMALADRLAVIEDGRIVQVGSAAEITSRPRSEYVADLVGVNLFRGRARGDVVKLTVGGELVVAGGHPDGDVLAVVHPRAVALHRRAPEGTPRNAWPGRAESVDVEGGRARVLVGGRPPIVAEVTMAAVAALGLEQGGDVWVTVKATEISVYPA